MTSSRRARRSASSFLAYCSRAAFEEIAGGGVELEHQAFFPAAPGVGRGAVGIGEGEEQQGVEVGAVFDDGGEIGDDLRVVEVAGGGGAPEREVVVHEEHDQRAPGALDLEAVAQPGGEHGRAVDVFADVFGAAGVMENHREIERVGILDLMEQTPVDLMLRVVFRNELVELFDAAQRVFVRGVAVEKLVLDEAVERAELGQVAAEEADAVHQAQDARDVALAFEDRLEDLAVGFRVAERPVDVVPVVGDETADLRAEL